jgi:hypothetical protein
MKTRAQPDGVLQDERKLQNVGPIDGQRCGLGFGLEVTVQRG